jgi:cytoplasmic tRNA 2-thiolation protein 1
MAPRNCALCGQARAILKRPKTGQQICKDCFFYVFETEIHNTITRSSLFKPGDRVAIGASGGKGLSLCLQECMTPVHSSLTIDSTVLAHVMKTLNDRHQYGLDLFLLSIDEGISGYRDDSLEVLIPACPAIGLTVPNRPSNEISSSMTFPSRSYHMMNSTAGPWMRSYLK